MSTTTDPSPPAGYHMLTPLYDLGCAMLGLGRGFREQTLALLDLRAGTRVLDLGCGTGVLACRLKARHPDVEVTGVDPTSGALAVARRRAKQAGVRVSWVEARGDATGLPSGDFDRVVSTLMLHHVPDAEKPGVLAECGRLLKPGGFLVIGDFSVGRHWLDRAALRLFAVHEHVRGQLGGRISTLMGAAGLTKMRVVASWRWGIEFIRADR